MKAKEYFAKYEQSIMGERSETDADPVYGMYCDFANEYQNICDARRVAKEDAQAATLREVNQKWEAVVNLFTKKYGEKNPIAADYFKKKWCDEHPGYDGKW